MTARCTAVTLSVVLLLAGAGCTPNKPSAGGTSDAAPPQGPAGTIPVGPGPQATYTVQAQPAPGRCHYRHTAAGEPLPDPACTPGARNPQVTQATIRDTICKSGWTATIRPPSSVTAKEKKGSLAAYAYAGNLKDVEYDHFLSLEFGGDPNDPQNLWPEPPSPGHRSGSGVNNPKDPVETKLKVAICSGKTTLSAAQQAIVADWTTALAHLGLR